MIAHLGVKTSVGREQPIIIPRFCKSFNEVDIKVSQTALRNMRGRCMGKIFCEKHQLSLHSN